MIYSIHTVFAPVVYITETAAAQPRIHRAAKKSSRTDSLLMQSVESIALSFMATSTQYCVCTCLAGGVCT